MDNSYNVIRIQQYLNGQLSQEEMHAMEKEALEDPFLDDAIEGYRMQAEVNHSRLSLLQQRLARRVENQRKERDRFYFGGQRLGIAATAAVLFLLVVVLFWMRSTMVTDQERLAGTVAGVQPTLDLAGDLLQGEAAPVGGWETLETYLQTAFEGSALDELLPAGSVYQLAFEIDAMGRPIGLTVYPVEGLDVLHDERVEAEFRRLLSGGPLWTGKSVTFNLRFED